MDVSNKFPEAITNAQLNLGPYIKQRQDAAQIRRVLASHLTSNVDGEVLSRPLSLVDAKCKVTAPAQGVRGLQKEYLRSVRANLKARQEYADISKEHRVGDSGDKNQHPSHQNDSSSPTEIFIDLVRLRQKHQRLRITQDYIDLLAEKPVASNDFLDPQLVLKDVESLPKVPSEVLNGSSITQDQGQTDLKDLVDHLEKSVLRAKILLKREQKLLAKVRATNSASSAGSKGRLQALVSTHAELIRWIESEMAKAGDGPSEPIEENLACSEESERDSVDVRLESIQRQYFRYTKAREALIGAATSKMGVPSTLETGENPDTMPAEKEELRHCDNMHATYPYLEDMVTISNEQKAIIQQKSHLTISLSKQLKETNQGMEKLASESHLLPAHPVPAANPQRKGLGAPISFADEISHFEKPDSSHHAQGWMFASQSAREATANAVLEKLREGEAAISTAQETLLELQRLLQGNASSDDKRKVEAEDSKAKASSSNIWSDLDGTLGTIKGDGLD